MGQTYAKEIAPWEQKSKYFQNVKSGYLEDLQQNIDMLLTGIRTQTEERIQSSGKLFVSADIMSEVIEYFSIDETDIALGILGTGPSFEWGISDVLWKIEQSSAIFKKSFSGPSKKHSDTNLRNLNQQAEEAYQKGWFDESLKHFLKLEKREGADFSAYMSMGMIYLLHIVNKENALDCFEKAENYASSRSKFYTSFSLLYQALIKRDLGVLNEAEALSHKAASLTPTFAEAFYQNAQYNVLLGKQDKAMGMLQKAIEINIRYALKVKADTIFKSVDSHLKAVFEKIRNKKHETALEYFEKIESFIDEIEEIKNKYNDIFRSHQIEFEPDIMRTIQNGVGEMEDFLKRGSIMDFVLMNEMMTNSSFSRMIRELYLKVLRNTMLRRKEFRAPFEKKIQAVQNRCNMFTGDGSNRLCQFVVTLAYLAFGTMGALVATSIKMSMPFGITGAIIGFIIALMIQFVIKRYGDTYDIDYSVYDTYNETETFLSHLKKLEKKLSLASSSSLSFSS